MILRFTAPDTRKQVKCVLLLTWLFAAWAVNAQEMDSPKIIEEAVRHQNLGLAYLEESQPSKAVEAFTALIELLPNEAIGYGNLAVAHLRLQQADAAEESVKRGIAVAPMDSQLHFILSEIYQLQGQSELAVEAMKEAVQLAPDALEFRYKLVRHYLAQRNDPEAQQEAVRHLQELHARSPVNVVVLLKLTQGLLAQEKLEDAESLCQELMLLLGDTDAEKLKYLTQGIAALQQGDLKIATRNIRIFENVHRASPRYQQGIGELVTDILGHPIETFSPGFKARVVAKQTTPITVDFVDVTEQLGLGDVSAPSEAPTTLSLIDYDSDGNLDLYIASVGRLLRNTGKNFISVQQFESDISQHTVAFADLNKDGTQDFLLPPHDAITYLQMDADGNWETSSLIQNEQTTDETEVLFPVDFDHDGDLDLFSGRATTMMYRNNGEDKGTVTFTDVSQQTFVTTDADEASSVQRIPAEVVSADFDDDGDIDIFVTHKEMGCTLYDNLRQGKLRAVSNETGIPQDVRYIAAAAGDYDNDGDIDIFLATAVRLHLYRNRGDGSFVDAPNSEASVQDMPPALLRNIDYDNDGFVDVWVAGREGMFLFRNDGTGAFS